MATVPQELSIPKKTLCEGFLFYLVHAKNI